MGRVAGSCRSLEGEKKVFFFILSRGTENDITFSSPREGTLLCLILGPFCPSVLFFLSTLSHLQSNWNVQQTRHHFSSFSSLFCYCRIMNAASRNFEKETRTQHASLMLFKSTPKWLQGLLSSTLRFLPCRAVPQPILYCRWLYNGPPQNNIFTIGDIPKLGAVPDLFSPLNP